MDQISNQAMSATQNVAAAIEETNATVQQFGSSAQSLASLAGDLQVAIEKFKL